MKKNSTKILAMLIALVLLLALFPTAALAANSDDGAGSMTIDTFTTGSLGAAITATKISATIDSLTINAGTLNDTDIAWIKTNLTSLQNLDIRFDAAIAGNALPIGAFQGMTSLLNISIYSVTAVGNRAFAACTTLANVSLISATTIGDSAFEGCYGLVEVGFPYATSIGSSAFSDCGNLALVELMALESIGGNAFRDCTGLVALKLGATIPTVDPVAFNNAAVPRTVKVPQSAYSAYDADESPGTDTWYGWTLYGMSEANTLASLITNIGTLLPTFDSDVGVYDIYVDEGATSIIVTPTATSPKTLLFRNNSGLALPIISGVPQAFNLTTDVTVITIMLFPESGSTQLFSTPPWNEYEITVTKGDPPIDNPDTGDTQNLLWIYLSAGALLCLVLAILAFRKRSKA